MNLSPGSRLGPYEILSVLGAGGMGEVYRARDNRLKRDVAIKVLPESYATDPDRLRRFEQEAQAASALNHPNILAIHDFGTENNAPYIVSELLEGETLRSRLEGSPLSSRKVLGVALQIAYGLAAAHDKGIVHRDLKPENIFVTEDGRVKILDFGLAKLTEVDPRNGPQTGLPTISVGTEPGVVLGTLGYMSPEQARGSRADTRSDIFSFGAILYEMLSGRRAFLGDSAADKISSILKDDPPELSIANHTVSPGLARIVHHCLEKKAEQRFHSAHDLAFDLEMLAEGSTSSGQAVSRKPNPLGVRSWSAILVFLAVAAGSGFLVLRPVPARIDSLAVLPFSNSSADSNTAYLSEGITESLTNALSRLPGLRVTARTISRRYRGTDVDPQKAGRDLGVKAVLAGQVLLRGDNLIIQTDLVSVADGRELWGEHYRRPAADILVVEEQITREVSEKLRLRMTGDDQKRLAKPSTENPTAYRLYLKARHAWELRTSASLLDSISFFNQAIDKDPGYALAYAGLADAYAVLSINSLRRPNDCYPQAKAAAKKALSIDDGLAEPHATLGWILGSYDWSWADAETEFQTSIARDPSYATAHHWYGLCLLGLGRFDRALNEMRLATKFDPLSSVMRTNTVRTLLYARRFEPAIDEARRAVEANPGGVIPRSWLGSAYELSGKTAEAIEAWKAVLPQDPSTGKAALARMYGRTGRLGEARKILSELLDEGSRTYQDPFDIARIYTALGEKANALAWLEKAYAHHSPNLMFLSVNPTFDSIRNEPEFRDLLHRLNLTSGG